MTVDINKILEGSVAVPYNQEILDCLKSACESYMEGDSKFDKMEEMTATFLTEKVSDEFRYAIVKCLLKQGLDIFIPDSVLIRLSLCAICCCFDSNNDELDKAIKATIFMNYMLVKKNQFSSLPNSTYIKEIYQWHISYYLAKNDTLAVGKSTKWIKDIAKNDLQTVQQCLYGIGDEDIRQIQMLVKEASFYRMRLAVENESIQSIENPYIRVFIGLNAMIDSMEHLYYYFNLQEILSFLIKPEEHKLRRKMSSFIHELRGRWGKWLSFNSPTDGDTIGSEKYLESSVLLRLIHWSDVDDSFGLLDMSFSVREFATYLYYELLLERITNK